MKMRILAATAMLAVATIGCSDSRDNFVFTEQQVQQQQQAMGNGALAFQFVRTQGFSVPQTTESFIFNFFDANGALVLTSPQAFANNILVNEVPNNVSRVNIRAFTGNNFPLLSIDNPISVEVDRTVNVDLSNAESTLVSYDSLTAAPAALNLSVAGTGNATTYTAAFGDGTQAPVPVEAITFASNNEQVATVSADGQVTGVSAGSAVVTASWPFNGTTRTANLTANVGQLTIEDGDADVVVGGAIDLNAIFTDSGLNMTNADADTTYAVNPPVQGFSIENNDDIRLLDTVEPGTQATVTATFTDANQVMHTTQITVTATDGMELI